MSSTLTSPPAAPQTAPGDGEEIPRPERRRGRPQTFGLNVKRLRRVRLICFAVLALPILALAFLTVKFVSMPITQAWHGAAYERGEYAAASERLGPVWFANWFEPYLPHLTLGTDLLQQGKDAEAEKELRTALSTWQQGKDLNQPKHADCKIRNNLAIAIERQADGIKDPGERGDRLYEAEEIMQPCAGGGGGGDGEGQGEGEGQGQGQGQGNEDSETTGENGERIRDKRREADKEAGKDPDERPSEKEKGKDSGEDDGDTPVDPGDPKKEDPKGKEPEEEAPTDGGKQGDQEKQDKLKDRNRDAQEGDGKDNEGSQGDPERPW